MKKNVFRLFLLVVVLAAWAVAAGQANAQQPIPTPSDDDVNRVAKQMYCPVCENIPLDVCPTTACQEWRELIHLKLSEGWNDQQIKDYFAMQYGDRVLAEPPRRGLNWLVYVLPPIVLLFGSGLLFGVLRRMRRSPEPVDVQPGSPSPAGEPEDEYLKRVEDELKRVDRS
jgi:cytochrome c-type biogenesis protein CcmH